MATRSQIRVQTSGEVVNDKDAIIKQTLYNHWDGYPEGVLPLIKQAWEEYGQGWEGARARKVASMLCAVKPAGIEPLDYHDLHGDIEFFYLIDCSGETHIGAEPDWNVTVYSVKMDFEDELTDEERLKEIDSMKVSEISN